jgi:glycosyltransferase involved in cell wall biosynthesis
MKPTNIKGAPCVSVLMPVFNTAPFVELALISVAAQEFRDFELVVVDDGSTDGTLAILKSFAAQEPRMRLIARSNRGLIATRNQLVDEARGEFIAWMDSDDLSHPARLKRLIAEFEDESQLVCVGSNVEVIDPDGKPLGVETYPPKHDAIRAQQMFGAGLRFPSTMQRRSIAIDVGGFREPFRIGEDFDYLLRVGERGKMANVQDRLYRYRQHLLSTCTAHGINWPAHRDLILSLARERTEVGRDALQRGESLSLPDALPSDAERHVPYVLLGWAQGALRNGDRRRALRYMMNAIGAAPSKTTVWRSVMKMILAAPPRQAGGGEVEGGPHSTW